MRSEIEEVIWAGKEIYNRRLVMGTVGNISRRLKGDPKKFAISPSGIDYKEIEEEDIVILNTDGEKLEGKRRPSTETPIHRKIYKARDDVKAIVHTHSTWSTGVACTREGIPPILPEVVQMVGEKIETADFEIPGSDDLAEAVVEALGDRNGALLANHGVVAVGENTKEALEIAELVEKCAKVYAISMLVGEPEEIESEKIEKLRNLDYGQP